MKRRLKRFNISNKLAYTLIVILFIITLGVGVYAIGSVPNPGHSLSQLQPCDNGQTLIVSGGAWTCTTPSSGSANNCRFCNVGCGGAYTVVNGFFAYSGSWGSCSTLVGYLVS